jgi:hypothetical protein
MKFVLFNNTLQYLFAVFFPQCLLQYEGLQQTEAIAGSITKPPRQGLEGSPCGRATYAGQSLTGMACL